MQSLLGLAQASYMYREKLVGQVEAGKRDS